MPIPDELWFRLLSGLLVGLALGSFTTMLAYRVPRGISIIQPPSHCPKCNTPLKPLDLIPVVSWAREGGKCRYCGTPIGLRYLVIEMLTTLGVIAAFITIGFHPALIPAVIGVVAFVTMAAINSAKK